MSDRLQSIDEMDLTDIADVIPNGHLILTRLEATLQTHIQDLWKFYAKQDPDQRKTGVPYQYMPAHQEEWVKCIMPISRQLASVDPLIMEKYQKLFSLEIAKATPSPSSNSFSPNPDLGSTIVNIAGPEPQQPPKQGVINRLFGRGRNIDMPSITPFSLATREIEKKKETMQKFYGYLEFHNFGLDWCEPMNMVDYEDFRFTDYTGIMNYLSIERTEFKNRINEVVTLISEGYESVRANEKEMAVKVMTSASQMHERHRDKMI